MRRPSLADVDKLKRFVASLPPLGLELRRRSPFALFFGPAPSLPSLAERDGHLDGERVKLPDDNQSVLFRREPDDERARYERTQSECAHGTPACDECWPKGFQKGWWHALHAVPYELRNKVMRSVAEMLGDNPEPEPALSFEPETPEQIARKHMGRYGVLLATSSREKLEAEAWPIRLRRNKNLEVSEQDAMKLDAIAWKLRELDKEGKK